MRAGSSAGLSLAHTGWLPCAGWQDRTEAPTAPAAAVPPPPHPNQTYFVLAVREAVVPDLDSQVGSE